jgi:hypothetical protein
MFHWTLLKNPPSWEKILHSTKHIADVDKNIMKILDEDGLFHEFIHIENISKTRMDEWNGLKYLSFSFAIPGTSAAIERVFSITNALWTDKKSCFLVENIVSVIVTETHFEELSCNDFYTWISNIP